MDIIRLRTLTDLSIMNFGQHSDMTVGQIIDIGKARYLAWCYFNLEGISFSEKVLYQLRIDSTFRINKPGTSEDKWDEYQDIINSRRKGVEGFVAKAKVKKRGKARLYGMLKMRDVYSTKGYLQAMNHRRY